MMTKLGWGWWRTGRLRECSFQNQVRLQETPDLHQLWSTFSFFKKTAWITRRVRHKCSALQLKNPLNSPLPDASERVPRLTAYQDKTPLQFRVIANLQPQPPPPKQQKTTQPQNHPDYNMEKITSSLTTQLKQVVVHLISITFKQTLS